MRARAEEQKWHADFALFGKFAPTFRDDRAICIGREAAVSDREGVRWGGGAACSFPESRRAKRGVRILLQMGARLLC